MQPVRRYATAHMTHVRTNGPR